MTKRKKNYNTPAQRAKDLKQAFENCYCEIEDAYNRMEEIYGSTAVCALAELLSSRVEAQAADSTAWEKE